MQSTEVTVQTGQRRGLIDLTADCARFVAEAGDGMLNVFVPHARLSFVPA